jgi:hypothetical protein
LSATLAGWAYDPERSSASVQIHVYVGGTGYPFLADGSRPDVNAVMNVSGNHGFSVRVPLSAGSNQVCAYAVSLSGGDNLGLGCRNVDGELPPVGSFDGATGGGGTAQLTGWAYDPTDTSISTEVHAYVGSRGYVLRADRPRADVNAVMKVSGSHGFQTPSSPR